MITNFKLLRVILLLVVSPTLLMAHEGHQPLPTKGVSVDLKIGRIVLSPPAREILDIRAVEVREQAIKPRLRAYATTTATWTGHAFATSRLSGRIAKLYVRPGDLVQANQILMELESADVQTLSLDYRTSTNDVDLSTKLVESLRPAAESGAVAKQQLFEAENDLARNQNMVAVLRAKALSLGLDLEELGSQDPKVPVRLKIRSPIPGVIVHSDVAVGKFVEPAEHLFEIVDDSHIWAEIGVLEQDLHRINPGQETRLTFSGLPERIFAAKIDKLGLRMNNQSGQGVAWAELINPQTGIRLRPGMNGVAELTLAGPTNAVIVPRAAVYSDGAERYVFVEETSTRNGSEYRKTPVVIGRQTRDSLEITSGRLFPGDRVVTQGGHELSSLLFLGVLKLSPETAKSIGLSVKPVVSRSIEQVIRLDAVVDIPPERRTFASSPLSGILQTIKVDRNATVKAGDVLAEVTSFELQDVQLAFLQASLDQVLWSNALKRRKDLGQSVSGRALLETQNRLKAAETKAIGSRQKLLALGLSSDQIDQIVIKQKFVDLIPVRAPIDGSVVHFDRTLGQTSRADEPLFEIHDLSTAWVQAFVNERDSAKVQIGQKARLRFTAYPDLEIEGKTTRISPVVGANSRTQSVWIEFAKPSSLRLLHNMFAQVNLVIDSTTSATPALVAPLEAVIQDGSRSFVFIQKDPNANTFERKLVELGRSDDHWVEIKSGLKLGENLAVRGAAQLQTAFSAVR